MGFGSERDSEGRLVLTMAFETNKMGRPGFLHGGAIAGMLEAVAFTTLAEALDADDTARIKPINVTVNYLRGGRDAVTHARATIERLGRRVANVEAIAWQDDPENPIAIAQMNLMLQRD
ncbi:MAG: PaaI family thioesterase [Sphingomonadaceae bacterium]|nr:PaaI family thioesterase [Sphingomonadaceae bacterium]